MTREHVVGVISDTHGLMRPSALEALTRAELIVHAGDVGAPEVLESLRAIAPVLAVRGNVDRGEWAKSLPETQIVEFQGLYLYVIHQIGQLDLDPAAAGFSAVISGHSHRPSATTRDGVLYLNPGSAGARRFELPVSLALLHMHRKALRAQLIDLAGEEGYTR